MKKIRAIIVITLLILMQTILYFLSKVIQGSPNILTSSLDNKIPYISIFVYFYICWYAMLLIVPYIIYINSKEQFYKYVTTYVISIIMCVIIFVIFPTTIERERVPNIGISNFLVNLIYDMDTPMVNCLPSIHCLIAYLYMFGIAKTKMATKYKIIIYILSLLIVLSTLFIKQHIIYDAIASLIIIMLVWNVSNKLKLHKKTEKLLEKFL